MAQAKRGRPLKSSAELVHSDARRGRIEAARKRERLLLEAPGVPEFLAAVRLEHSTFLSRCRPNDSVCLDLKGPFVDNPRHFLTQAKDTAREYRDDPRWLDWHDEYADFLNRLLPRAGQTYIDPLAARSVEECLQTFAPPDFVLWNATLFRLVDYFASKKPDGSYIFNDRDDMGFQDEIEPILNQASEVLTLAQLPTR
jgi:hypothetical protein